MQEKELLSDEFIGHISGGVPGMMDEIDQWNLEMMMEAKLAPLVKSAGNHSDLSFIQDAYQDQKKLDFSDPNQITAWVSRWLKAADGMQNPAVQAFMELLKDFQAIAKRGN